MQWRCPRTGCPKAKQPYAIKGAIKKHLKEIHKEDASEEALMACQVIPPGQGNEKQRESSEMQTEPTYIPCHTTPFSMSRMWQQ